MQFNDCYDIDNVKE